MKFLVAFLPVILTVFLTVFLMVFENSHQALAAPLNLDKYKEKIGKLQLVRNGGVYNDISDCKIEETYESDDVRDKYTIAIVNTKETFSLHEYPKFNFENFTMEDTRYGEPGTVYNSIKPNIFNVDCDVFEPLTPVETKLYLWPNMVAIEGKLISKSAIELIVVACRF